MYRSSEKRPVDFELIEVIPVQPGGVVVKMRERSSDGLNVRKV